MIKSFLTVHFTSGGIEYDVEYSLIDHDRTAPLPQRARYSSHLA